MKTTKYVAILMLVVTSQIGYAQPVEFQDVNLKAAVETELGIVNPNPTDMLSLMSLNARNSKIVDLSGLEYALNLKSLWLKNNAHTFIIQRKKSSLSH